MARPKVRDARETKKKVKRSTAPVKPEIPNEILLMWREEVQNLMSRTFGSIHEVMDTLAGRICARMGQPDDGELKGFLMMILDTDPEIRDELQRLVRR